MDPPPPAARYIFGPFELDPATRRLTRDGERVPVLDRHIDILLELLAHPGQAVSKDALIAAAWKDVAVTDNSLEQAISVLRKTLNQSAAEAPYIETVARRGYRVGVPVDRRAPRSSREALDTLLAPFQAFIEGRAALESLERDAVARAYDVFHGVLQTSPDYAPAHVGLANALALRFEAARAGATPDREALEQAVHHAAEACRLDPSSAEAWCVLGHVAHQSGDAVRAKAAVRRATTLEPDNWRHQVRLAYVSWGEERLQAARRALRLCPGLALAHWLAATVYIARQAFGEAERELTAGAAAQDRQVEGGRFKAVGLHLLRGLLELASGDTASARGELERELSSNEPAVIYSAQARSNAWCAMGALHLRLGAADAARQAFDAACDAVPGHPVALAARAFITADAADADRFERRVQQLREAGAPFEAAFAETVSDALHGRHDRAASRLTAALERQPAGSGGWTIPVDPLLHVGAHPVAWALVLALLRSRAT